MWIHGITGVFKKEKGGGYKVVGESYHEDNEEMSYVWTADTDVKFNVNKIESDVIENEFEKSLKKYIFDNKNKNKIRHLLNDDPFR